MTKWEQLDLPFDDPEFAEAYAKWDQIVEFELMMGENDS